MGHRTILLALLPLAMTNAGAQVLVDSIPLPGINQGFWGIHVEPDTIFLGADFNGNVYCFDHAGAQLSTEPTGFTFNHGLIKKPTSYLIAQDYTTSGAHLYEVSFVGGTLLNTWTFPAVIGGNSSGIGDICADGNAIWYTMYYPDFDVYPYAYAYKWVPGDPAPIDTVPMQGEQPYGIALKGDTLFYVTDDLNGDLERIYAYDLTNEQLLGSIALPDPDNDQSPRGMFYDGEFLYLVANRVGGSAFAYQTVFIYAFDATMGFAESAMDDALQVYPNPTSDHIILELPSNGGKGAMTIKVFDALGRDVWTATTSSVRCSIDVSTWDNGIYKVQVSWENGTFKGSFAVEH
jgi:Secretion system C-terminal sorting domain